MPDPIADYERAADAFAEVLGRCDADLSGPSPCEGWLAQDVVDHVLAGTRGMAEGFGAEVPADAEDVVGTYDRLRRALTEAAGAPGGLDGTLPGPAGGELPKPVLLGIFTSDTLLHTWDLARATGQPVELDADLLERSWQGALPMDEAIRRPGVFGPKIAVDDDAPMPVKALAFFGRDAR